MWPGLSDDTRDFLTSLEDPSGDVEAALGDGNWMWLFSSYLQANGANEQATMTTVAANTANGMEPRDVYELCGPGGAYPLNLDSELAGALENAQHGYDGGIAGRIHIFCVEGLREWWTVFVDEATRIRHWSGRQGLIDEWESHAGDNLTEEQRAQTTGMPVHTTMSVEDLDKSYIDGVNQVALKDLEEGDSLEFKQYLDYVLIGNDFPPAYVQVIETAGDRSWGSTSGIVTMVAKGGTFSTGRLGARFTGAFPDRDNFEAAVARVSKKSVRWS